MSAHPTELMDSGEGTNDGMILNQDMPPQCRSIRHHHLIADLAVVCDVGVSHDKIIVPYDGLPAAFDRTSMKRDKLPDDILMTDH
jgi:hypothetical protein